MLALILALSLQAQNDSLRAALAKCATVHQVSPASKPVRLHVAQPGRAGTIRFDSQRSAVVSRRGSESRRAGAGDPASASRRAAAHADSVTHSPEKVAGKASATPAPAARSVATPPSGFLSGRVGESPAEGSATRRSSLAVAGLIAQGDPSPKNVARAPGFYRRHPALTTLGAIGLGALIGAAICNTNHEHGVRIEWRTREVLTDPPPPVVWPPDDDEHHHKRGGCK